MDDSERVGNNAKPTEKRLGGITGKGFMPGESGNPSGRPKKKPLTELYEQILNDPEHMALVEQAVVKALKRGQMAMVLQLREMAERVEGKVVQPIDADVRVSTIAERLRRARERREGRD